MIIQQCCFLQDVFSMNQKRNILFLQVMGLCLNEEDITKSLGSKNTSSILQTLCGAINNATDKTVCTRALWCLSKQKCDKTALENEVMAMFLDVLSNQC